MERGSELTLCLSDHACLAVWPGGVPCADVRTFPEGSANGVLNGLVHADHKFVEGFEGLLAVQLRQEDGRQGILLDCAQESNDGQSILT